jgi:signal transduction histidine kinase/CheY-like chemotaxis protein
MRDLLTVLPLASVLFNLFLFAYIYGQERQTRASRAFLLFSMSMLQLCLHEFLIRLPLAPALTHLLTTSAMAIFTFSGFLYLNFVYAIIGRRRDWLYYGFFGIAGVCCLLSLVLPHHSSQLSHGNPNFVAPTGLYVPLFALTALPGMIAAVFLFGAWQRESIAMLRKQKEMLLLGYAASMLFGIVVLNILPVYYHNYDAYRFSSVAAFIHVLFIYRAIRTHKLLITDTREIGLFSRLLFEKISEGVLITDLEGEIIEANASMRAMLGSPLPQQVGRVLEDKIENYHFSRDYTKCHFATKPLDFSTRQLLISQSAFSNFEIPIGRIIIVNDITELKRVEAELAEKSRLEALGQLAGGVAHDFNNQLAGIQGCVDILKTELSPDNPNYELVSIIDQAALRSAQLTRQLLAFARKGKFQIRPTDIHAVIEEVCLMLQRSVQKNIIITKQLQASLTMVKGDPDQLHHMLLNLALNGRDAMPNGGTLSFATTTLPAAQGAGGGEGWVQIAVIDSGSGMSVEVQRRMFEPFFTTKEKHKGTGMGLAAVYGTVQNHSGTIEVQSSPGQGTSMVVRLPLMVQPAPEPAPRSLELPMRGAGRVLIIDDEPVVRLMLSRILQKAGYVVEACDDGIMGIERYREIWHQTDVVILDLVMPRLSGLATYEQLRQINPACVVLVSSGYSVDGEAQKVLDAGAQAFIQKPFVATELLHRLSDLLNAAAIDKMESAHP